MEKVEIIDRLDLIQKKAKNNRNIASQYMYDFLGRLGGFTIDEGKAKILDYFGLLDLILSTDLGSINLEEAFYEDDAVIVLYFNEVGIEVDKLKRKVNIMKVFCPDVIYTREKVSDYINGCLNSFRLRKENSLGVEVTSDGIKVKSDIDLLKCHFNIGKERSDLYLYDDIEEKERNCFFLDGVKSKPFIEQKESSYYGGYKSLHPTFLELLEKLTSGPYIEGYEKINKGYNK